MEHYFSHRISHLARQIKVEVLRYFVPKGISKYTDQLKSSGITIRNLSAWEKHGEGEIRRFVEAINNSGIRQQLESNKQRLSIAKDDNVPLRSVIEAANQAMVLLHGQTPIVPFPSIVTYTPEIDLVVSSEYRVPMCVLKKGVMVFGTGHLSRSGIVGMHQTKEKGWEVVSQILERQKLPSSDYRKLHLSHVNDVITAYYQIGAIYYDPHFIFTPEEARKQRGLLMLFDPGVSEKRIEGNIGFLKKVYLGVPYEVIMPTIIFHDLGKIKPEEEASHPEVSAKLLEKDDSLEKSLGLDHISWLIIKNSVRDHLVFGGISLGEYSHMSMYDVFEGKELFEIISSGRVNEFIDNLTLLTACDISGQNRFIPLNRNLEDLAECSQFLKDTFQRAIKRDKASGKYYLDQDGRNYFHKMLTEFTRTTSERRLCRYLGHQDDNLDINTNEGYVLYQNKLKKAFDKMKVPQQDRDEFLEFFALLRSFPYSGVPLNHMLWNISGSAGTAKKLEDMEVSESAIRFLIYLSKRFHLFLSESLWGRVLLEKIERNRDFIFTANFINRNGKPIRSVKGNRTDIDGFVRMVNEGEDSFPRVEFVHDESMFSMNVYLTESQKKKKRHIR